MSNQEPIQVNFSVVIPSYEEVLDLLNQLTGKVNVLMMDLSQLQAEVERNNAVDQSAIELLNGLATQLSAIAHDPAAVQKMANDLRDSTEALAAAVAANTPAAPDAGSETPTPDQPAPDQPAPDAGTPDQPATDAAPTPAPDLNPPTPEQTGDGTTQNG